MTLRDTHPCGRRNLYFGTYPTGKTRGLLFNRRDARDEEPLREPARLLGRVWEDKRYTRGTGGHATFARKRRYMPPKQYEGPASYALTKEEKEIFFECLLSM